jgi:hypothetical protein
MISGQPWIRNVMLRFGIPQDESNTLTNGKEYVSDGSTNGLRIRFNVYHHIQSTDRPSTIEVYNLSSDTRKSLQANKTGVILDIGYTSIDGSDKPQHLTILTGELMASFTRREGPDLITTLLVLSGAGLLLNVAKVGTELDQPAGSLPTGFVETIRGRKKISFAPPVGGGGSTVKLSDIIKTIGQTIPRCLYDEKLVVIPDTIILPKMPTLHGNCASILNQLARTYRFSWNINANNTFVAVHDDSAVVGNSITISAENGNLIRVEPMLNGPLSQQNGVTITSVLNPNIIAKTTGSKVMVISSVNSDLNNTSTAAITASHDPNIVHGYKVTEVTHTGDTHSTQWQSQLVCLFLGPKKAAV